MMEKPTAPDLVQKQKCRTNGTTHDQTAHPLDEWYKAADDETKIDLRVALKATGITSTISDDRMMSLGKYSISLIDFAWSSLGIPPRQMGALKKYQHLVTLDVWTGTDSLQGGTNGAGRRTSGKSVESTLSDHHPTTTEQDDEAEVACTIASEEDPMQVGKGRRRVAKRWLKGAISENGGKQHASRTYYRD